MTSALATNLFPIFIFLFFLQRTNLIFPPSLPHFNISAIVAKSHSSRYCFYTALISRFGPKNPRAAAQDPKRTHLSSTVASYLTRLPTMSYGGYGGGYGSSGGYGGGYGGSSGGYGGSRGGGGSYSNG